MRRIPHYFAILMGILPMSICWIVELCKITDWPSANKLSLNVNKTKCMIFHSGKKKTIYPRLFIDNIEVERVDYFNFLGLQLHHTLKWNKQLSCISLKISKITGLLHKLKSEYPTSMLKSIYNTLILPNINYCILSWRSQINKLYLLQKKTSEISQTVSLEHILRLSHCLKNTIYLKYKTYILWQF